MNEVMKYIAGGAVALMMIVLCLLLIYCMYLILPYLFACVIVIFFLGYAKRRGQYHEAREKELREKKEAAKGL